MTKIEQLKREVEQLPPDDLQLFREWVNEFETRTSQVALVRKQSGTKFLLGVAGMFSSGPTHTSENVREI
ncbi:MAG: hypothetical protein KF770_08060 [Anaerolineae bacterium]|nr:hypothetical protein [Anaerolineae bacterium]